MELLVDKVAGDLVHLHKLLPEPHFHFPVNLSSQLQNAWVLSCCSLLCQKLQILLVVEELSRQPQRVKEYKLWEKNWVMGARKKVQAESFQQNLQNTPVGREDIFFIRDVDYFSVPNFCGSFWKPWGGNSQ